MKLLTPLTVAAAAVSGAALIFAQHQKQRRAHEAYVARVKGLAQPQQYRNAPLVIVIDVGSSSIRTSCFALLKIETEALWVLLDGSLQQQHVASINDNGEADIYQISAIVERLLDQTLHFLRAAELVDGVVGVGFSTFVMNVVGVDEQGEAATPVYTYAGRPSTAACARQLRQLLFNQGRIAEFHDRTGTVIHPAYAPAEFLRLHQEEPATLQRVFKWQSISGYLIAKWTTAAQHSPNRCMPISFSEASWMGLLDFRRCQWDHQLLKLVHMDLSKMPPLTDSSTPFTGLRAEFISRWPELKNVPFFLGIGDGAAANIGSKCIDHSRIAVTIGTSAAVRVVLDAKAMQDAKMPKGLWCYRIDKEYVMLGGALNDGGSVYEFFRKCLRLPDEDLEKQLLQIRPNQHHVTILPFLSGERAPGWLENASCTISGINKWVSPIEILHAGLESVALRLSILVSLLAPYADPNAMIVASGTALASSKVWRQMVADCIGKELVLEKNAHEITSRGIAVFMGTYLGLHSFQETAGFASNVNQLTYSHPRSVAHAAYLAARHEQESLYRKLYAET